MDRLLKMFLYTSYILVNQHDECSAKRWHPFHLVGNAVSTDSPPPTVSPPKSSSRSTQPHESSIKIKLVDATPAHNCNSSSAANGAIIKGSVPDDDLSKETTAVPSNSSVSRPHCRQTAEICRYTLPPVPSTEKFMIGVHGQGKFSLEIHKNPRGREACCHSGGGLPKIPDEFEEQLPKINDEILYQKALSGQLAEQIVDAILKKSEEKGNPVIDPAASETQLKALSRTLGNSMLESEGCCYKLSGELKCFLDYLLLQRPTRRKRSCSCSNFEKDFISSNEFHIDSLSSVNLPVGLYGFQPPLLMNLP